MNPTFQIPLRNDLADYLIGVDLDGASYQLRLWWCDTLSGSVIADGASTGSWYLSINQPDGTPILQGLRCVCGYPMGWRFVVPGKPPGKLNFIDTTGKGDPPGLTDLGQRVQLIYVSAYPTS